MERQINTLVARIDAALHRIELASAQLSDVAAPDTQFSDRHARLRAAASDAVSVLDMLIAKADAHG